MHGRRVMPWASGDLPLFGVTSGEAMVTPSSASDHEPSRPSVFTVDAVGRVTRSFRYESRS